MSFFVVFMLGTFLAAFALRGKGRGPRAAALSAIVLGVVIGYFFFNRI